MSTHLPGPVECKPFVGNGGAGDVAAQVLHPLRAKQAPSLCLAFEFLPLMGGTAHLGMEANALLVGAAHGGSGGSRVGRFASSALSAGPGAQTARAAGDV